MDYDIAIVGAGPAGAALACALAARWRVALIDKLATPPIKIGEALVPATGRLLRDLGLTKAFQELSPASYLANRSIWGSAKEEYRDFISDPEGPGWLLDRPAFETMLRTEARRRGAACFFGHRLSSIEPEWRLSISGLGKMSTKFVVDATGRASALARLLGSKRLPDDKMVARWCRLTGGGGKRGVSSVIATETGWWYHVSGLRNKRQESMLAFHSLPTILSSFTAEEMLRSAKQIQGLCEILDEASPIGDAKTTAAHSSRLERLSGKSWLAIGDAAICFDPIASRGMFHAIYSAYVAAALLDENLRAGHMGFSSYDTEMLNIYQTYLKHRLAVYQSENRWPQAEFWQKTQDAN